MQTSAAAVTKPAVDQVQLIPVEKIKPSPFNARKEFPKEYLAELGASIARDGQQQPVKVRPVKDGYELVFGECRWRSSQLVGVKELKAIVEPMDDARAEHLCLIENLKRKDLTVFEEAEKLKRLHEVFKVKVEDLAVQVGLSVRSVRENLKLAVAQPAVRELVLAEKLSVSNAKQISRVSKNDQEALAKLAAGLGKDQWNRPVDPMTHDELEKHIRDNYLVDLRFAPFDVKQKGLACIAPTCGECPKRSGNAKDDFPDLKSADLCTSPADFRKKLDLFVKQRAAELGAQVISADKAEKIFGWDGEPGYNSGFVKAHSKHPDDEKDRSYKQLLGKEELSKRLLVARNNKNEVVELLSLDGLDGAIKKEGRFKKRKGHSGGGGHSSPKESKEDKTKRLAKEAFEARVKHALIAKLVEKVEAKGLTPAVLKAMAMLIADGGDVYEVLQRRGIDLGSSRLTEKKFDEHFGKLKGEQLAGLVFEFSLAWQLYGWKNQSGPIATLLGVDEKKIEAEVKADMKTEEAAAAAAPAKKGAGEEEGRLI